MRSLLILAALVAAATPAAAGAAEPTFLPAEDVVAHTTPTYVEEVSGALLADGRTLAVWGEGVDDAGLARTVYTTRAALRAPGGSWSKVSLSAGDRTSDGYDCDGAATAADTPAGGAVVVRLVRPGCSDAWRPAVRLLRPDGSWTADTIIPMPAGRADWMAIPADVAVAPDGRITVAFVARDSFMSPTRSVVLAATLTADGTDPTVAELATSANADSEWLPGSPRVATDATGRTTVIWQRTSLPDGGPMRSAIEAARTDAAGTWAPATTIDPPSTALSGAPRIVADGATTAAVWTPGKAVALARWTGDDAPAATTLYTGSGFQDEADVALSADGTLLAVWREGNASRSPIRSARLTAGAATPTVDTIATIGEPTDVHAGFAGLRPVAAWQNRLDGRVEAASAASATAAWGAVAVLDARREEGEELVIEPWAPVLATRSGGDEATVLWTVDDNADSDHAAIRAARFALPVPPPDDTDDPAPPEQPGDGGGTPAPGPGQDPLPGPSTVPLPAPPTGPSSTPTVKDEVRVALGRTLDHRGRLAVTIRSARSLRATLTVTVRAGGRTVRLARTTVRPRAGSALRARLTASRTARRLMKRRGARLAATVTWRDAAGRTRTAHAAQSAAGTGR